MLPEQVAKTIMHAACEACMSLGYSVEVRLKSDGNKPDLDSYSQKSQALLTVLARAERHVRGGRQRQQSTRGSPT